MEANYSYSIRLDGFPLRPLQVWESSLRSMKKIQFVSIHASALLAMAYSAHAAAIPVDPSTMVTATMDGGIAKTGNTWYELGVNLAAATTGLKTGLVVGQADPLSTFLFQPAAGLNTLLLDSAATSGTLTFNSPLTFSGFAIAGSSGNGAGTIKPTLHFADGSSDVLANGTVGDWFNNSPRIETVGGRINVPANRNRPQWPVSDSRLADSTERFLENPWWRQPQGGPRTFE